LQQSIKLIQNFHAFIIHIGWKYIQKNAAGRFRSGKNYVRTDGRMRIRRVSVSAMAVAILHGAIQADNVWS
jgi:hypothetical protein